MNKDLILNNLLIIKNIVIKHLPIILIVLIITLLIIGLSLGFTLGIQGINKKTYSYSNINDMNSLFQYNIEKIEQNSRLFDCDRIVQKAIVIAKNECSINNDRCSNEYLEGLFLLKNKCNVIPAIYGFPITQCNIPSRDTSLNAKEQYLSGTDIQ